MEDLSLLPLKMHSNLKQISRYIAEYCHNSPGLTWCEEQITEFEFNLANFKARMNPDLTDDQILSLALEMREFANDKYKLFQQFWTTVDTFAVASALLFAWWLLVHFTLYGVMDSSIRMSRISLIFLAVLYFLLLVDCPLFGYKTLNIGLMQITFFLQVEIDVTQLIKDCKKQSNQCGMAFICFFIIMQFSEAMQTEADTVVDSFVVGILLMTYLFKNKEAQPRKLKTDNSSDDDQVAKPQPLPPLKLVRNMAPYALILLSVKMAYFLDKEKSLNFQTDPALDAIKQAVAKS